MTLLSHRHLRPLILCLTLALAAGCRTIAFRDIQRDFQDAVRADNAGDPFSDGHESVVATLTPEYISALDARLRPNAWMLRAVSAWRSGQYRMANESAERGRRDPGLVSGSRDDVILNLVPALAIDGEQTARLSRAPAALSGADYRNYETAYKLALQQISEARNRFNEKTPEDVAAYFYYQRWRLLQHWTAAINRLDPREPDAIVAATEQARRILGKPLDEAVIESRDKIPTGHPLRNLVRAQGGQ